MFLCNFTKYRLNAGFEAKEITVTLSRCHDFMSGYFLNRLPIRPGMHFTVFYGFLSATLKYANRANKLSDSKNFFNFFEKNVEKRLTFEKHRVIIIWSKVVRGKMKSKYNRLSCGKMRELAVSDRLEHKHMSQPLYEILLYSEAGVVEPSATVIDFCIAGLKRFDKYKDYDDIVIWGNFVSGRLKREQQHNSIPSGITFVKPSRKRLIIAIAAAVLAISLVGCAAIFDFFGTFLNIPLLTKTEQDGKAILRTEDERFYKSLEDLFEFEKIDILYPATLPDGYAFTDFEVRNRDVGFEVALYAESPYIDFRARIDSDYKIDDFDYEVNGIKYSVFEHESLHQAHWNDGEDYYAVTVGDESLLTEIIENLKRS